MTGKQHQLRSPCPHWKNLFSTGPTAQNKRRKVSHRASIVTEEMDDKKQN